MRATDARQEIDGVSPLIHSITQQIAKELREIAGVGGYGSLRDIERVMQRNPNAPPPEILERAFSENFQASGDGFDKTLFHYLLTRLAKVSSRQAVEYCLKVIPHRPEETKYVLRYLGAFPLTEPVQDLLLGYLGSPEAVYDYQLYEIVKWFYEKQAFSERLLQICRKWAFDKNRSPWLRAYCIAVMGEATDSSDFDEIENQYGNATTEVEKLEVVVSLCRMELGRRNSFMGRLKGDGFLVEKAVEYVRGQTQLLATP